MTLTWGYVADFRNKFLALHKSYSPNQAREIYVVSNLPFCLFSVSLHILRDGHGSEYGRPPGTSTSTFVIR